MILIKSNEPNFNYLRNEINSYYSGKITHKTNYSYCFNFYKINGDFVRKYRDKINIQYYL